MKHKQICDAKEIDVIMPKHYDNPLKAWEQHIATIKQKEKQCQLT